VENKINLERDLNLDIVKMFLKDGKVHFPFMKTKKINCGLPFLGIKLFLYPEIIQ
jgi:hypothetical protein